MTTSKRPFLPRATGTTISGTDAARRTYERFPRIMAALRESEMEDDKTLNSNSPAPFLPWELADQAGDDTPLSSPATPIEDPYERQEA